MPKLIALVIITVMVASACSSAGEDIAASADSDVSEPSSSLGAAATSSPTTAVAVVDKVSSTTPEPIAVALPSGRDAIAAAEGSAHVLWFWGAH